MRAHRTLIACLVVLLVVAVPSVAAARRLIIGGSTSVLPLMQKLTAAYHKAYPHIPAPSVSGGQSDIGIHGAAEGRFDIGDSSRDPILGVDPHGLVFTKIARDGVCVITNKANAVGNMSQETVYGIFTGRIRNWSEVQGAKIGGPIDLFDRDGASGTQDAFQHIFLGETTKVSPEREHRDLQRPRATVGRRRQTGDRLRVVRVHGRREPRRVRGDPLQPAQRPLRAVRRRA